MLLERLARGEVTFRDLAGLKRRDVESIAHLGRVAFESRRFERAARIFAGLEALEADRPEHVLHRAYAEAEAGRGDDAIASATRYIDRDDPRPAEDVVRALLLRAQLFVSNDRRAAALDVRAAELIAASSPAAKAVLEGGAR
jgi:hypothetical protein